MGKLVCRRLEFQLGFSQIDILYYNYLLRFIWFSHGVISTQYCAKDQKGYWGRYVYIKCWYDTARCFWLTGPQKSKSNFNLKCHFQIHFHYWCRAWVGVTTPISAILLFSFTIAKTLDTYWISHSYLTGVTAAQLLWHPSYIRVIQRNNMYFCQIKILLIEKWMDWALVTTTQV